MKVGVVNNCINCNASYSTYNVETEGKDDWLEKWCELPVLENGEVKRPKGVCQFCNFKSKYYINQE